LNGAFFVVIHSCHNSAEGGGQSHESKIGAMLGRLYSLPTVHSQGTKIEMNSSWILKTYAILTFKPRENWWSVMSVD
jgi:hypothetical protein